MSRKRRRKETGNWIPVPVENYDQPDEIGLEPEFDRGGRLDVFVSPFEVPRGVRGEYDPDRDCFVIKFKYVTREEWKLAEPEAYGVKVRVGKQSGRVLGFEIDVHGLEASSVELRILQPVRSVLEALDDELSGKGIENRLVTAKVIEDQRTELFRAFQEAH